MISIKRLFSFASLAVMLGALGISALAQDAPTKDNAGKVEQKGRMERRMGKEGFGGRRGMRGMRGMQGRRGPQMFLRGLRRLELTDAQKEQVKTLMESHRTANQPLREELRGIMAKRRDGTITDADKTRAGEIRQSMKTSGEQLHTTVLGLLTPEQTQKLEQMKAERQERMEQRRQRMVERRERFMQKKSEQGAVEKKPVEQ